MTRHDADHPPALYYFRNYMLSEDRGMATRPHYHLFVGVDIAVKTFTATWGTDATPTVKPSTFPQTPAGLLHSSSTCRPPVSRRNAHSWFWKRRGVTGLRWPSLCTTWALL